jgi:hypothetical protein
MEHGSRPRRRPVTFRPRFTLLVLYVGFFFVAISLLAALPDLIEAFRSLPPGPDQLTDEELDQARQIARNSLRGKLPFTFAAAVIATGIGSYRGWLPGMKP